LDGILRGENRSQQKNSKHVLSSVTDCGLRFDATQVIILARGATSAEVADNFHEPLCENLTPLSSF